MVESSHFFLANSLTQVMWAFFNAVLFGNVIIGLIEGAIIRLVFHARWLPALGWMIVANLASAWLAGFVFGMGEAPTPIVEWLFDEPLYHARAITITCMVIGILMTLIVEWPFCYLILRGETRAPSRSIRALLLVHAVSLTCLLSWFWPVSRDTLGHEVTVVRGLDPDRAVPTGWVYYLHRDTGDVRRVRLDGSVDEHVLAAGVDAHDAILFVKAKPGLDEVELYELQVVTGSTQTPEQVVARFDAAARIAPFLSCTPSSPKTNPAGADWTLRFGMATADLRNAPDRFWQAFARYNGGLVICQDDSNPPLSVIFDTPFDTWRTHSVTALPGDLAVFDFGLQVCLLDVRTRRLTLLAPGVGPVVVLDGEIDKSQP